MEVAAIPLATDPPVESSERPASPGGSFDLVLSTLAADWFGAPPGSRHMRSPVAEVGEGLRGEVSPDADPASGSSVARKTGPESPPAAPPVGGLPRKHPNSSSPALVAPNTVVLPPAPGGETDPAARPEQAARGGDDVSSAAAPEGDPDVVGVLDGPETSSGAAPGSTREIREIREKGAVERVVRMVGPRGLGKVERLWAHWVRARVGRAHGGAAPSEGGDPEAVESGAVGDAALGMGGDRRGSGPDLVTAPAMVAGVAGADGVEGATRGGAAAACAADQLPTGGAGTGSAVRAGGSGQAVRETSPVAFSTHGAERRVPRGSTPGNDVAAGDDPTADGPPPEMARRVAGSRATAPVSSEPNAMSSPTRSGGGKGVSRAGPVSPVPEGVPSAPPDEMVDGAGGAAGTEAAAAAPVADPTPDEHGEQPARAEGGEPAAAPAGGNGRRARPPHPAVSRAYPTHEPPPRTQSLETVSGFTARRADGPPVSAPLPDGDTGVPSEGRQIGVPHAGVHPDTRSPRPVGGANVPGPAPVDPRNAPNHVVEAPSTPTAPQVPSPAAAGGGAEPAPSTPALLHPGWAASNAHRLAHSIRVAWDRGRGEMRLRLDPPNLGRVQVVLRQGTDGLSAQLRVENIGAQHLLAESVATLREALGARGVPLADVSVTVDSDSGRQAGSEAEIGRRRRRGRRMGLDEVADTGSADPLSSSPGGWTPWGFETRI